MLFCFATNEDLLAFSCHSFVFLVTRAEGTIFLKENVYFVFPLLLTFFFCFFIVTAWLVILDSISEFFRNYEFYSLVLMIFGGCHRHGY